MFKSIVAQSITAVAAATLASALVVFLTSVVPEAKADSQVKDAAHQPYAEGDRLPVLAKGAACSTRGWPHYEQTCQFDKRRAANEARKVRVIVLR